jgi:hypothetical protein
VTAVDLYCSRSDVNDRLPPGSITSPAGILASCLASTDTLTYDGHGLETDREVTVRAADGGTLAAPLVAGTVYYAKRLTNSTFQLAATAGGAAINITTNGVEMVVTREPLYDDVIEFVSRWADGCLIAHATPLTAPIHPLVRGVVADVAAKRILNAGGSDSAIVKEAELAGKAMLERLKPGVPLRGASAPIPTNLAVTSTAATARTLP